MVDLRVEDDDGVIRILGESHAHAIRELRDAVDDIADKIEAEAKRRAPVDTGELASNPVERSETEIRRIPGIHIPGQAAGVVTDIPLFGGGTAIRGARGRFVKGAARERPGTVREFVPDFRDPGRVVIHIELSVPELPKHAVWVHGGTGVYGPHESPIVSPTGGIMRFVIDGRVFYRRSVLGQRSNPYLLFAYEEVNDAYVPLRLAQLQQEVIF